MNKEFDAFIQEYLKTVKNNEVKDALVYALGNGKRFRPSLVFAVTKGFGLPECRAYHAALALEMIHSYSLIHDDLPCMDDDDFRRGKPSVHKAFAENIAVLAGDALLTEAFKVMSLDNELSAEQKIKMIYFLSDLAGIGGMIHGQVLDLRYENAEHLTKEILDEIEDYKTGCLFKCSLLLPMVIVEDEEHRDFYEELGLKIGRIFQIQDDLFDIIKSEEEMGKPTGSDEKNNKATALSLMSIDQIKTELERLFEETNRLIDAQKFDTTYIKTIIHNIKIR